jgi:hypothetical protein
LFGNGVFRFGNLFVVTVFFIRQLLYSIRFGLGLLLGIG